MGRGLDKSVRVEVERAIMTLKAAGAELVDIELPHTEHAIAVYYIIATSEASTNLARYGSVGYGRRSERADSIDALYEMGRGEGFGDEVKRRIILGTWCLSSGYYDAYYDKASRVRTLISQDFDRAFDDVDVICGPTSPCPPFKLGEKTTDPLAMYLADVYTVPASLAGLPGISVPAGFAEADGKRLPVGLQILAKRRNEAALFQTARALEGLTTHAKETPAS
jgi:aspartyl-tRNA(Asn)/glutamyl-tRNA(Gln) amidotransferase subunit A